MPKLLSQLYPKHSTSPYITIASATIQCKPEPADNITHMIEIISEICDQNPDIEIIFFGETILGWYARKKQTKEYHHSIAQPIPGKITNELTDIAFKFGIYLCFGMTEADDGEIFNTQVLINPHGEIQADHRKFHLMESTGIFSPGKIPATIVEIKGIKTGIIVCSDIQSPAVRKFLKAKRVKLILGALANPKDPNFFVSGMIAKLFDSWIVTANRYGEEDGYFYEGDMMISNPLGQLHRTSVGQEQFICEKIFFATNESCVKQRLRRIYVGISFISFLLKHTYLRFQHKSKAKGK